MSAHTQFRSRLEFGTPEEWQCYVSANVPPEERSYVLTRGLIALYLRFYECREQEVPSEFINELHRIEDLSDPTRAEALQVLNAKIFADMTRFLKEATRSNRRPVITDTPRVTMARLLHYLEAKNPSFTLWASYRRMRMENHELPNWEEHVRTLFVGEPADAVEFTLLIGQLGELLLLFQDRGLAVPALVYRQIWFLHHQRPGKERNFHAKVLAQELLEVLPQCTSA